MIPDTVAIIAEDEVPLAALPKTGEGRNVSILVFISGLAAALYLAIGSRKEKEQ